LEVFRAALDFVEGELDEGQVELFGNCLDFSLTDVEILFRVGVGIG
jgi:hypothetical protein